MVHPWRADALGNISTGEVSFVLDGLVLQRRQRERPPSGPIKKVTGTLVCNRYELVRKFSILITHTHGQGDSGFSWKISGIPATCATRCFYP